jgi:hypothetical protein
VPDSLFLPCVISCVHRTGKLLFTGNIRSLFFPVVSKRDPFTDLWGVNKTRLLSSVSKQDVFTFFLPGKLFVKCETHVGLAGRYFSRDFVFSPTHSCNETMLRGFIDFFILTSLS